MLIQPLYLDTKALEGVIATVEGGLRTGVVRTDSGGSTLGGSLSLGGVGGKAEKDSRTSSETTFTDHDVARLHRLLQAASEASEALGWIHVLQPDEDLKGVLLGAFIEWECDVFVPDAVQMFRKSGGALDAITTMKKMLPIAQAFGLDTGDLPPADQMEMVSSFIEDLDAPLVIVGEDQDDSDWKIVGVLRDEFVADQAEFDGPLRVIGKVRKIVREGAWTPLTTLPGMNLVTTRAERRKRERTKPSADEEANYVAGPALVLDVLAAYR